MATYTPFTRFGKMAKKSIQEVDIEKFNDMNAPYVENAVTSGLGSVVSSEDASHGGYLASEFAKGVARRVKRQNEFWQPMFFDAISYLSGRGDYQVGPKLVMRNYKLRNKLRSRNKMASTALMGSTVVQHRSFITDIVCSSDGSFKIDSFDINPGVGTTFPWLNVIANNFEEYTIDGLVFEYKSTSGDSVAGATTALGAVIMATEYNVANPVFISKNEMENHFFAQSAKPSINQLHAIECKASTMPIDTYFVRNNGVPSGYDKRFYDIGRFSIASQGLPGGSAYKIGELWITYQIRLKKAKITSQVIGAAVQLVNTSSDAVIDFGTATTTSTPAYRQFGDTYAKQTSRTHIDFYNTVIGAAYLFKVTWYTPSQTVTDPVHLGVTNATPNNWAQNNAYDNYDITATGVHAHVFEYYVSATATTMGLDVDHQGALSAAGATNIDIWCVRLA